MAIQNVSVVYSDERAAVKRKAIEQRATWMALTYKEGLKDGANMESITRRAITTTGSIRGAELKASMKDLGNCLEFRDAFLGNPVSRTTFQMEFVSCDEDELNVNFHYCPLLAAWQKLGIDEETCVKLCDMAMDGDRAIAAGAGLKLDISETIAQGCPSCRLRFHKQQKTAK